MKKEGDKKMEFAKVQITVRQKTMQGLAISQYTILEVINNVNWNIGSNITKDQLLDAIGEGVTIIIK